MRFIMKCNISQRSASIHYVWIQWETFTNLTVCPDQTAIPLFSGTGLDHSDCALSHPYFYEMYLFDQFIPVGIHSNRC